MAPTFWAKPIDSVYICRDPVTGKGCSNCFPRNGYVQVDFSRLDFWDADFDINNLVSNCWFTYSYLIPSNTDDGDYEVQVPMFLEWEDSVLKLKTIQATNTKSTFEAVYHSKISPNLFQFAITQFGHADYNDGAVAYYDISENGYLIPISGPTDQYVNGPDMITCHAWTPGVAADTAIYSGILTVNTLGQSDAINIDNEIDGWHVPKSLTTATYNSPTRGYYLYGADNMQTPAYPPNGVDTYGGLALCVINLGTPRTRLAMCYPSIQQWPGLRTDTVWSTDDMDYKYRAYPPAAWAAYDLAPTIITLS